MDSGNLWLLLVNFDMAKKIRGYDEDGNPIYSEGITSAGIKEAIIFIVFLAVMFFIHDTCFH